MSDIPGKGDRTEVRKYWSIGEITLMAYVDMNILQLCYLSNRATMKSKYGNSRETLTKIS